jgi:hypothetical protein
MESLGEILMVILEGTLAGFSMALGAALFERWFGSETEPEPPTTPTQSPPPAPTPEPKPPKRRPRARPAGKVRLGR